jgi:hypothetical protein
MRLGLLRAGPTVILGSDMDLPSSGCAFEAPVLVGYGSDVAQTTGYGIEKARYVGYGMEVEA